MTDFGEYVHEVAAAFDVGTATGPMREVDRGETASIWRLDTSRGSYAVKRPLRGHRPRNDGGDLAFQEAVGDQTAVLYPRPVRTRDGSGAAMIGGQLVRVNEWLDIGPIDVDLDPGQVGETLAALHQVEFDLPGEVDAWYTAPLGLEAFQSYADRLLAEGAPFAETFRAAIDGHVQLELLMETPQQVRTCHCDLWANNLRATRSGGLCVIDWDNSGPADPGHELAMVVFEFGYLDARRARAVHESYVAAGGPARLVRPSQLTMVIAQFGHFYEDAATSWLDPAASAKERVHAGQRIAELQDRPLSVEVATRIIDSVS